MIADLSTPTRTTKTGRRGYPVEMERAIERDYAELGCCHAVGKKWARSPKVIRTFLRSRGHLIEKTKRLETVEYKGRRYSLQRECFVATVKIRNGLLLLHHVVWVEHHGSIPANHRITFKDGNPRHWQIGNLQCVPRRHVPDNDLSEERRLELAQSMAPYIESTAGYYADVFHADRSELRHLGLLQAWQSAQRYQKSQGCSFFGYSRREIRNAMLEHCKRFAHAVSVPRERFGAAHCFSIQAPLGNEPDSATFEEYHLGEPETVTTSADRAEMHLLLEDLMAKLPARERSILQARFFDGLTQRAVAEHVGLTHQRVQQIERDALATMRKSKAFRELIN